MQNRNSSLEITNHGEVIQFSLRVPVELRKEGAWFYSSCRPFDIYGQGKNEEEATKSLVEALQLFVESCFERGVLEKVLKDCGFRPAKNTNKLKKSTASSLERMIDYYRDNPIYPAIINSMTLCTITKRYTLY